MRACMGSYRDHMELMEAIWESYGGCIGYRA